MSLKVYESENKNVEIWDPETGSWIVSEMEDNGFPKEYKGFVVWF